MQFKIEITKFAVKSANKDKFINYTLLLNCYKVPLVRKKPIVVVFYKFHLCLHFRNTLHFATLGNITIFRWLYNYAADLISMAIQWRLTLTNKYFNPNTHLGRFSTHFHDFRFVCHRHKGKLSEPFEVHSGVHQGCILSPILFLIVLGDVIKAALLPHRNKGLRWTMNSFLQHLDYADDICLLSQRGGIRRFKD